MVSVVVSGGRDFWNKKLIFRKLDKFHEKYGFTLLIQGEASGVDSLCKKWAISKGIPTQDCPADWKDLTAPGAVIKHNAYGPYNVAAGTQRNQSMIDNYKPYIAVIFPGGTGTADMKVRCIKARKAGIIHRVISITKKR